MAQLNVSVIRGRKIFRKSNYWALLIASSSVSVMFGCSGSNSLSTPPGSDGGDNSVGGANPTGGAGLGGSTAPNSSGGAPASGGIAATGGRTSGGTTAPPPTGGRPAVGGAGAGGAATGGNNPATGGAGVGGAGVGGAGVGGAGVGGAGVGGAATGGAPAGIGGKATGGAGVGGAATGGKSSAGGAATGGKAATGGAGVGGGATGGSGTGGSTGTKTPGTAQSGDITVDPTKQHQIVDGFGLADVWQGSSSTQMQTLLWDPVNGIGLNLLRVGIDGTSGSPDIMGAAGYADGQACVKFSGSDCKVWAAPWSPPAGDKDNNNVNGTVGI